MHNQPSAGARSASTTFPWGLLALAFLTLAASAINFAHQRVVVEKIERIQEGEITRMLSTEWTSGGQRRTATSTWKEHDNAETYDEFVQRHIDEVAIAQRLLPPDPTPGE